MRRKLSTILDENLVRRAKLEAVRQEKQLNELIAEALEAYLTRNGAPQGVGGVVNATFGAISLPSATVTEILRDEGGLLED